MLKPGAPVGRFVLQRPIGRGGFGEVWLATDPGMGRPVAIKFLSRSDEEDLSRFRREARLLAGLSHPGIAAVYEAGDSDDGPWLAMQFVDGVTLRNWRGDRREMVRLLRDAALAIHEAHASAIVHRDLKPENLMVDGSGRVCVMDFGLSRRIAAESSLSQSGFAIGTPSYMSPEQARGDLRSVDARSDVYGLGATLYDLLAGRPPFTGDKVFEILVAVVDSPPRAPSSLDPSIDSDLEAVVLKCLEKSPAARYQDAPSLAADLDRWLRSERVHARPAGALSRLASHRAARWSAALAALLLVVAPGAWGWLAAAARSRARAQEDAVRRMRSTSEASLEAALEMRRLGNLDGMVRYSAETETVCRRAIEAVPTLAEPHWRLGRILRAQLKFTEALVQQELALSKDPSLAAARLERGLLRTRLYQDRIDALRDLWLTRHAAFVAGRRSISDGRVTTRQELETGDAEALRLRALARDDLSALSDPLATALVAWLDNRLTEAFRLFEEAARAQPLNELAWEWLSLLDFDRRDFVASAHWCTEGLRHDRGYLVFVSHRAAAWYLHGRYLALRGEDPTDAYHKAIADIDLLMASRPLPKTLRLRAEYVGHLAYAMDERGVDPSAALQRALADFDEVIRVMPDSPEAHQGRAMVRIRCALNAPDADAPELYRLSLADLDTLVRLAPANSDGWLHRAMAHVHWGQHLLARGGDPFPPFREALASIDRAVGLEPSRAEHWTWRGDVRVALASVLQVTGGDAAGTYRQAILDLDEGVRISPAADMHRISRAIAHTNLAMVVEAVGGDPAPEFKLALADLDEAVRINASRDSSRHRRGILRTNWGRWLWSRGLDPVEHYRAAVADLDEAIRINPRSRDHWISRALARSNWAAAVAESGGSPDDLHRGAMADCDEAIRLEPSDGEAWLQRGLLRTNHGKRCADRGEDPVAAYTEAVDDFTRALRICPTSAESHYWRGNARRNWALHLGGRGEDPLPRLHEAIADAGGALRLNPRMDRAWALRSECRTQEALWRLQRGLDPGRLMEDALRDAGESIRLGPANDAFWSNRAQIRSYLLQLGAGGDWKSVLADADEAVRLNGRGFHPRLHRGTLRFAAGTTAFTTGGDPSDLWNGALADLDKALSIKPADPKGLSTRGGIHGTWGMADDDRGHEPVRRYEAAVKDLEAAVTLTRDDRNAWMLLGHVCYRWAKWRTARGDSPPDLWKRAEECYREVTRMDPSFTAALKPLIEECAARRKP